MIRYICMAAVLVNFLVSAPVSEIPYLTKNEIYWRAWLPGIARPDAGTIEVTVRANKPMVEFGNWWEFLFVVEPRDILKKGGNILLGLTSVPPPDRGLTAVLRTDDSTYRANVPDVSFQPGKKINLAISWGAALTLYINGKQVARTPLKDTPPERIWPDHLRMNRFGPWNPQAVRISTIERDGGQMASDPEAPFTRDNHTSLMANDLSRPSEVFQTAWHQETAVVLAKPVFRAEKQCYLVGEQPVFPVVAANLTANTKMAKIDLSIMSISRPEPTLSQFVIDLPANTSAQVFEFPLTGMNRADHHTIHYRISGEGLPEIRGVSQTAVFPRDRESKEGTMARFYGVHHPDYFAPEVWTKIASRTSRVWDAAGKVFLWWKVEPVKGEFHWDAAEAYVKECQSAGMDIIAVLGYPSRWATIDPGGERKGKSFHSALPSHWKPISQDAWARYVRETVTHFKGRVKYWEIYNEINWCIPAAETIEEYLELQKIAYREAKTADPHCVVTTSSFTSDAANKTFPSDFSRLGGTAFCDVLNVHNYSGVEGSAPWVKLFKEAKPGAPIWQTEQMWHTMTAQPKRTYLTVAWPIFHAEAGYGRFFNMDHNIFFSDFTHSPSRDQFAIGVFQNEIYSCEGFAGRLKFEGDSLFDLRHQFRRTDGKMLTVLGSENAVHEVHLAKTPNRVRDLFGHPVLLNEGESGVRLQVSNLVYLVTDEPVVVRKAIATLQMGLLVNGQFEEVQGDIGMFGLEAGKPRHFILHEKTRDPEGWIHLTDKARSGSYALRLHSSGKGQVSILQETSVPKEGTYVLSGHFLRLSGDAKPYVSLGNRDTKEYPTQIMENAGDDFRRLSLEVTLPAKNTKPLALIWGIASGSGEVIVDDVTFEPKMP